MSAMDVVSSIIPLVFIVAGLVLGLVVWVSISKSINRSINPKPKVIDGIELYRYLQSLPHTELLSIKGKMFCYPDETVCRFRHKPQKGTRKRVEDRPPVTDGPIISESKI